MGKRPQSPPVTPEERARVQELHAAGKGRNEIARDIGRDGATITKICRTLGLSFEREATRVAVAARKVDLAARRAEISAKFLAKADDLLDQIDEPHLVFSFGGKFNEYNEHTLDKPPTSDIRNLMTSAAVAMDKHLAAEKHDTASGAEQIAGLLGGLLENFQGQHGSG